MSAVPGSPTVVDAPNPGGPHKVGDYTVLGVLGSGGMGVVYRAHDPKVGREVALKMLHVGSGEGFPEELHRFRQEAETLGRLQHPNIVSVFDFGMHDGCPFLVMEYVPGGSLFDELRGQPQPPRKAAERLEVLARALHAVHEVGIVHRDLKPGNVLITADKSLKVTDFGLAKRLGSGGGPTVTGAIMGTPEYMAPEQARGDSKAVGPAADVWALGALLYEMLTGKPPFRGATWKETLEQVCMDDPAPPSRLVPRLPRDLQTVCLKCLHKSPARRYPTALALAEDLRAYLDGMPVKARPTGFMERAVRAVLRRPLTTALLVSAAIIASLAVGLGIAIAEADRQRELTQLREAARAREEEALAARRLEDMFRVVLKSDLTTEHGLEQVKALLMKKSAEVQASSLATVFLDLAVKMRQRGANPVLRQETLARAAELAATDPTARLTLAGVRCEQSWAASARGQYAAAKDASAAGLKLLEEPDPSWPPGDLARLRAELLHRHAEVLSREEPGSAEAQALYEEARDLRRGLTAEDADWANLARTLGYLGDVYVEQRDYRRADEAYWESHEIRERLTVEAPKDAERMFQLARSWANFGGYQARRRSLSTALYYFDRSQKVREDLIARHPDSGDYRKELAGVLNQQAELLLLTGKRDTAMKRAERAGALMSELLADKTRPDDPTARAEFARSFAHRARAGGPLAAQHAAAARDAFGDVRALRTGLSRGLSADELYDEAAALALVAGAQRARESLEAAYAAGYRRLAAEDVARDAAFVGLIEQQWFRDLIAKEGAGPGTATGR